jgi:MFS family permease
MHNNNNGYPSSTRAWMTVAILMLAYVLSFVDRQILNLLVGPIRQDLGISDTQMSLLMGFSFGVFYATCGLPLAWWADRHSRRGLITAGVCAWSLATATFGMAGNYSQMLLARIGVGVGEASLSPAAFSLIADYFPRGRRATAISVFGIGTHVGAGLAFLLGGALIGVLTRHGPVSLPLIGEIHPWQVVFLVLGAVGLVFAVLVLAIREPERKTPAVSGMVGALAVLRRNRTAIGCHNLGFGLVALAGYGAGAWLPTYFIRILHWTPARVGLLCGGAVAVFGTLGIIIGGRLTDRLHQSGKTDAAMRVGACSAVATVPILLVLVSTQSLVTIAVCLCATWLLLSMPFGAAPAALQEIVPPAMRARFSAVYLFVISMLGLGVGPTAIAVVTDYCYGDDLSVGLSIKWVCTLAIVVGSAVLWRGLPAYRASYRAQTTADMA